MSTDSTVKFKLHEVVKRFRAWGDFVEGAPYGSGHINDTFRVSFNMAGAPVHYLLQRINHKSTARNPAIYTITLSFVTCRLPFASH